MTEAELIRKADTALADLAGTGLMHPEQSQRFIRKVMDTAVVTKDARYVNMKTNTMEINKIGLGQRVLRAANQGTISSPLAGENGTRALSRADRIRVATEKVTITTSEVIAELDLPYEVLEDAIEGGDIDTNQFQQTVLDLIAQRVSLDLEEMVISSDKTSSDTFLKLQDGLLKLVTSNIVNQGGDPMDPQLFANMIKALPDKYQNLLSQMRIYLARTKEIDYRMAVAQRQTALGDSILTGNAPVSALGVPMASAAYMPNATAIMMVPSNLIIGVQRNLRMEFAKDIRERAFIMVLTMRLGIAIEQEDMMVKAINIG